MVIFIVKPGKMDGKKNLKILPEVATIFIGVLTHNKIFFTGDDEMLAENIGKSYIQRYLLSSSYKV